MAIYEENRRISFYDLDKNSNLTPISIVRLLNEISLNHNDEVIKKKGLSLSDRGWMINRWKIDFNNIDKSQGNLKIRTWISHIKRFFVYREFEVLDERNELVAIATAEWIFIDMNKRRPTRLDKEFIEAIKINNEYKFRNFSRYPKDIESEIDMKIRVRRIDIDSNRHVNNLNYIIWFLENIPEEIFNNYKIENLEIEYREEVTYPSMIKSKMKIEKKSVDQIEILHQIDDDREETIHAYGKTIWKSM